MDPKRIRQLLDGIKGGATSVDDAMKELAALPFRDLGFAHVDHQRHLRVGFPEVVFGMGKSAEQIAAILTELAGTGSNALATRVDPANVDHILARVRGAKWLPEARAVVVEQQPVEDRGRGVVMVVSAGTSDIPVAEEAALVARLAGSRVERVFDVGVAGIHRVLAHRDAMARAEVIVVVAGMEGALPSVVAGLVGRPVIAVPTSVGYGASFGGIAALLGMLNSCATGVTVVNIDNGFGAGYAAALINRRVE
jgi:NCAIR mutase (PurE)-related protein